MRNMLTVARYTGTRRDITASTTSAATAAGISTGVNLVRISNMASQRAYIAQGVSGIAVTTSNGMPLDAGEFTYLAVAPGEFIAAILESGTGTVAVCEMSA